MLTDMNKSGLPELAVYNIVDEVRFYSIYDLIELTGWSEPTVQKLFNDPKFPAVDYGKQKVVEKHALIRYFSERREKKYDSYWRN